MRQLAERMGFLGHFVCTPSPTGCDISDNGLSPRMDVNVLDADNLLTTFTARALAASC
jgi:hypothetical protein